MGTNRAFEPISDLEAVVSDVASSKKYRTICPATIRRVAQQELEVVPHGPRKAAAKATKRKLHQVYGAFEQPIDYETAYWGICKAYQTGSEAEIKAACRQILSLHSSTRERLPILDRFYHDILEITGRPGSVLDLGCGLNPIASPWMNLAPYTRYVALDIDAERIDFLNRYLTLAGLEPSARCQDVLVEPPEEAVDLVFLLKMSPSLERQEPGATLRLIDHLCASAVVVSFAIKSLGGREKGMVKHYRQQFQTWAESQQWLVVPLIFETELAFVIQTGT
jgi:16S rRNA (guanine(1405)-N(7))-methyltransferase